MHNRLLSDKSQKSKDNELDLASKEIKNKIITIYVQADKTYIKMKSSLFENILNLKNQICKDLSLNSTEY